MTTVTDICNLALGHLGSHRITDFDEPSALAEKCRNHFGQARDSALRMHRWNFAVRRAELSALADPPLFGYAFAYQLPADCIRLLSLNGVEAGLLESESWRIEGRQLLTHDGKAQVRYVARVIDTTQYDSLFVTVLSYRLAAALAMEVTNSMQVKGAMLEMADATLNEAGFVDAVEDRPRVIPAWQGSPAIKARLGAGRRSYGPYH